MQARPEGDLLISTCNGSYKVETDPEASVNDQNTSSTTAYPIISVGFCRLVTVWFM